MINNKIIYRIALCLWVAILGTMALASHSWMRGSIIITCCHNDYKHFIGAFFLAMLAYKAFELPSFKIVILLWSISSVVLELLQQLLTGGTRSFEFIDIFFNITGFALGAMVILLLRRRNKKIRTKEE